MLRRLWITAFMMCIFLTCCGFAHLPNEINTASLYVVEDNKAPVYFIGDSRLYMMRLATGPAGVNWLAECGSGFEVLMNKVVPEIDGENLYGKTIIIEYGINDIILLMGTYGAIASYTQFFNTKAQEWIAKGAVVKFVQVMPTGTDSTNAEIDRFNAAVTAAIPPNIHVVNLKNALEYGFLDNVHYNDSTSVLLYNLMLTR